MFAQHGDGQFMTHQQKNPKVVFGQGYYAGQGYYTAGGQSPFAWVPSGSFARGPFIPYAQHGYDCSFQNMSKPNMRDFIPDDGL